MKSIWKYNLETARETQIAMPAGAEILAMQNLNGTPRLWALVDPSAPKVARVFRIYGTGWDIPDDPGHYIGTFDQLNGALVYHVFEATT